METLTEPNVAAPEVEIQSNPYAYVAVRRRCRATGQQRSRVAAAAFAPATVAGLALIGVVTLSGVSPIYRNIPDMLYPGVGPNGPPGLCSEWLILPDDSSQTTRISMMTASTHQGSRQNAFFHDATTSDSFLTRSAKLKDTPERPSRERLIHITWRCFAKAVVFLKHSALSDPVFLLLYIRVEHHSLRGGLCFSVVLCRHKNRESSGCSRCLDLALQVVVNPQDTLVYCLLAGRLDPHNIVARRLRKQRRFGKMADLQRQFSVARVRFDIKFSHSPGLQRCGLHGVYFSPGQYRQQQCHTARSTKP
jgi:hypothetical protein